MGGKSGRERSDLLLRPFEPLHRGLGAHALLGFEVHLQIGVEVVNGLVDLPELFVDDREIVDEVFGGRVERVRGLELRDRFAIRPRLIELPPALKMLLRTGSGVGRGFGSMGPRSRRGPPLRQRDGRSRQDGHGGRNKGGGEREPRGPMRSRLHPRCQHIAAAVGPSRRLAA